MYPRKIETHRLFDLRFEQPMFPTLPCFGSIDLLASNVAVSFKWSFLCILGSLLRSRYRMRIFFWGRYFFKYCFGVLKIPDIFWGVDGICWARAYV